MVLYTVAVEGGLEIMAEADCAANRSNGTMGVFSFPIPTA